MEMSANATDVAAVAAANSAAEGDPDGGKVTPTDKRKVSTILYYSPLHSHTDL